MRKSPCVAEAGEEVAPLGPRLALHEATRDKHANIDADETAAVIADILEQAGPGRRAAEAKRRVRFAAQRRRPSTAWKERDVALGSVTG